MASPAAYCALVSGLISRTRWARTWGADGTWTTPKPPAPALGSHHKQM